MVTPASQVQSPSSLRLSADSQPACRISQLHLIGGDAGAEMLRRGCHFLEADPESYVAWYQTHTTPNTGMKARPFLRI